MDAYAPIDLGTKIGDLMAECIPLQGFTNYDYEMVSVEGFGQEVVRSFLHGLHRGFNGGMCGHDDDRNGFRQLHLGQTFQHIKSRDLGQCEIQKDELWSLRHDLVHACCPSVATTVSYPEACSRSSSIMTMSVSSSTIRILAFIGIAFCV